MEDTASNTENILPPTDLPLVTQKQSIFSFSPTAAKLLWNDCRVYYWNTTEDQPQEFIPKFYPENIPVRFP